jgi:hypothetical protein
MNELAPCLSYSAPCLCPPFWSCRRRRSRHAGTNFIKSVLAVIYEKKLIRVSTTSFLGWIEGLTTSLWIRLYVPTVSNL